MARVNNYDVGRRFQQSHPIASAQTPQSTVSTDGTNTSGVYAEAFSAYRDVTIKTGNATTSGFRVFNSASTELFHMSSARRILVLD